MDHDELKTLPRSERIKELFDVDKIPDYQADLLDYHEQQDKTQAAPKKGRQVGATFIAALIAADYALTHSNETTFITAPNQDPAENLFREFKRHFRRSEYTKDQLGVEDDKATEWTFSNGHRVICRTLGSTDLSQRGISPSCVIVDEAEEMSTYHGEEVIEPFFITHSEYEYYLIGTPLGKSGYFYHAVEGNNKDNWYSPHWPTEISPFADEDYLERKRQEKNSTTFDQEYRGVFADTGEVWIPSSLFRSCVEDTPQPPTQERRYLFVDVARKGKDRTVFLLMGESGFLYNIWSEETSTVPGVIGRIKSLHREHGFQEAGVDENAVGGGVVDDRGLQDLVTGITFSTKSKDRMFRSLKTAFEDNQLTIPNDVDYYGRLERETTSLEFDFTQNGYLKVSHPPGGHDDFADALAGCNYIRSGQGSPTVRRTSAKASSGNVMNS